jgi:hypothetical protein
MKTLNIQLEGVVVVVGNYGSGKTEIVINLAAHQKRAGMEVRVADLDLVNPYFRTREARKQLAEIGIEVVLPPEEYLQADLPILSPLIAGMIRKPSQLTLIDVGGDDAGATVLAALADAFAGRHYQMLQVVNPFRPYTDTISGCLKIRSEIETAAALHVTGWAGNANLIDETRPADIVQGYEFLRQLAAESGLPLLFVTAATDLMARLDLTGFSCPVLPINRQLVPPWIKAERLN